jgi:hypothetical protein
MSKSFIERGAQAILDSLVQADVYVGEGEVNEGPITVDGWVDFIALFRAILLAMRVPNLDRIDRAEREMIYLARVREALEYGDGDDFASAQWLLPALSTVDVFAHEAMAVAFAEIRRRALIKG